MLAIITKASSDYWYKIKEIKTLKDVLNLYPRCIVEENDLGVDLVPYWDGFRKEDIPLLKKAKCHITIYDNYVE